MLHEHAGTVCHPLLPLPPPHISKNSSRFKYIDDLALCEAINLKNLETIEMERPLNYRDRTMHHLPSTKSSLQENLHDVERFCTLQQMNINNDKSKTIIFNTRTKKDFTPRMTNLENKIYEHVENFKLLGVEFVTDNRKGINFQNHIKKCIN